MDGRYAAPSQPLLAPGNGFSFGMVPVRGPDSSNPATGAKPRWRPSSELWYFSGENQGPPFPTEISLSVDAMPTQQLHWQVTRGSDKVEFVQAGRGQETRTSEPRVGLRSTGPSDKVDDVRVRVSGISGAGSAIGGYEDRLSVRTPASLEQSSTRTYVPASFPVAEKGAKKTSSTKDDGEQSAQPGGSAAPSPSAAPKKLDRTYIQHQASSSWGYETHIGYKVLDDRGNEMNGVAVNEKWATAVTNDFAGCNWTRGPEGASTAPFFDMIGGEAPGKTPPAQAPPSAPGAGMGSVKVQHWTQQWWVGSSTPGRGTKVQTNTLQKYQDHADHESVTSP